MPHRALDLFEKAEELAHLGHWLYNPQDKQIIWSDEIFRLHGLTRETYTPNIETALEFFHPDDRIYASKCLTGALETAGNFNLVLRLVRADDQQIFVRIRGCSENGDNGAVKSVFGIMQDITADKKQERAVIENAVDAMIIITNRGTIETCNPASEALFGYTAHELIGQNISTLMPTHHASKHDMYLKKYAETGQRVIIGEIRELEALKKNGEVFPIELSVSEMSVEGESFFTGIIRDISERKELSASILKANEELSRSNQELDDFAYIASHDLKEPLRGMSTYASFILEDCEEGLDDESRKRLNTMISLAGRMERLIDQLLYFSRIGRSDMTREKCDISTIAEHAYAILEAYADEQNVTVKIDPNMPKSYCDPVRLEEVFRNLIVNGIKYNDHEEKLIEIGCLQEHPDWPDISVYFVRDNGIGVRPEHQDKVKTLLAHPEYTLIWESDVTANSGYDVERQAPFNKAINVF